MIYLLLSILASVLLLVNFRLHPHFGIQTRQAIVFNYPFCVATGLILMPEGQVFSLDLTQTWTWIALSLGIAFIVTFVLSGLATQRMGLTLTSLANNVSLVIPVLFSLWVFQNSGRAFDVWNYAGLGLALVAVVLSTFKPEEKTNETSTQKNNAWWLIIAVFVMYGMTNTVINYMNIHYIPNPEETIPVTLVMLVGAIAAGVILLVRDVFVGKEKIAPKNIAAGIALGIPNFLSFYWLLLALRAFGNSGALVYPLYNIGVILVAALVGIGFFKEKIRRVNQAGLVLAVIAILLISYQEIFS